MLDESKVITKIKNLQDFWYQRNLKFLEWYEILTLVDILATRGMESYTSSEPLTFYNMAHFLLTKGELQHSIPVESESALELDKKARVHRGCQYMWKIIDRDKQLGGNQPYLDELAFYLLVLGWYATVQEFERDTGLLKSQIWNPYDTYPQYANNKMAACVHSYKITEEEAGLKAEEKGWNYQPRGTATGEVDLDDYFQRVGDVWHNMVLINKRDVTGWVERPEMSLLVAPVAGFPDKGSLTNRRTTTNTIGGGDWKRLTGRSIYFVNESVGNHFNKWKSQISQILRDTSQPITEEFSATPQATPEQLRDRGAHFHYAPGERGLERVPPATIPIEVQAHLLEIRRELQKGSFNDAVYGMVEGQPGYALSLLATSSANQILYPYMDGKHFVIGEIDRFWLSNLKTSKRVFQIKGKFIEKLSPTDIPDDVIVNVESDVATPKDWLERGTIGGMLRSDIDKATLLTEIYKFSDPQAIIRRQKLDNILDSQEAQLAEKITGFYTHADYLDMRGDIRQAGIFRKIAQAMEAQVGAPAPGQGKPEDMSRIMAEREAGAPAEKPTVPSRVTPPETTGGFTPQQLRRSIGKGTIKIG